MQRSLFLLTGTARLLGHWQLAAPGSLPTARQVAASFLALVAQARPGERFTFCCAPVSPSEKVSSPMPATVRVVVLMRSTHCLRQFRHRVPIMIWSLTASQTIISAVIDVDKAIRQLGQDFKIPKEICGACLQGEWG